MGSFRWRAEGYDDADAEDFRLKTTVKATGEPGFPVSPQPYGDLLNAHRNLSAQAQQVADAQRRRAARAEARLAQLRADVGWFMLGASVIAFGAGFALAWAIIRRGGGW